MKNLDDLRRARAAAATKMRERAEALAALEGAETPDAQALASAQADFEASEQAFEAADKQVKRAERVEAAEAAAAGPADLGAQEPGQGASAPAIPKDDRHRGVEVGLMVGALAAQRGDVGAAAAQLERGGFGQVAAALSASEATAGGVTIPRPLAQEVIGLLRPRVVVRRAGARSVPMPAGQLRKARQTGSATASYGAEVAPVRASAPSFEPVDQSFKKLRALVPISNTLLAQSSIAMGLFVRDDLVKSMARREDLAFLRGAGAAEDPIGMRNWIPAGNWLGSVPDTVADADLALRRCLSRVEDADVAMTAPGWVMRASTKNWLGALKDANGNPLYPSIDTKGELKGFPIHVTSQLPNNLGDGSNETEIMFADFAELMIGESGVLRIAQSTEAAYIDEDGNMQSAFANDQTLMRAIAEHDFAPEHDVAIAGFSGIGWSL